MPRFLATFEDPNYMGYFYTMAAFALVSLKLFRPTVRYVLLAIVYGIVITSLSMSALVVNILLWPVFLVVTRNIKLKAFVICILIIFAFLSLYRYGLNHPDVKILWQFSQRLEETIEDVLVGDISDATTGRTDLVAEHLNYYFDQPFLRMIFGGSAVNTQFITYPLQMLAHNEYVDLLLNVGLLGTLVLVGFTFYYLLESFKIYMEEKKSEQLCIFMIKCIWCAYCMTLTVFMDYRFMLPFFI